MQILAKKIYSFCTLSLLFFLFSGILGAEESIAKIIFVQNDDQITETSVALVNEGDKATLTLPKSSVPQGTQRLEIHHPYWQAAASEPGFFVFPDAMYGTFREGEDRTYKCNYTVMAMFGVKTPKAAMMVLLKGMRYEAQFRAVRKNNQYDIYLDYILNEDTPYDDISLELHFLNKETATYSDVARAYRNYQLEQGIVRPLKERIKERPELAYAADSMEVRVRMAWKPVPSPVPEQDVDNEPDMKVAITFDRFQQIVDEFKKQGIPKAEFCLVGWNIGGHDGRYPQIFPVDERLGGEARLKEAIAKAQANGYQIVCHTNNSDAYRASQIGDCWDENYLLQLKDGTYNTYCTWGGGNMYETCLPCIYERFIENDYKKLKELGFRGLHYVDVLSTINPRTCYSKEHPLTKEGYAEWTNKIFATTQEEFGGLASEGGFDHCISHLDFALYISFYRPGNGLAALVDRHVPLWQLVYNGIVLNNPYTATTNYTIKDPKTRLKLIEFGGRPAFYFYSKFLSSGSNWMGDLDITCATDEELVQSVAKIKEACDEFEKLKYLQLEFMEDHKMLAENVFKTTFSDGTSIITNYNDLPYTDGSITVEPAGYFVYKKNLL